jgi:hypothetical protein
MKVLFDASVLSHAVRLRRSQQPRTVTWGGKLHEWSATVLQPKPSRTGWLQDQINALPAIAALARAGRIQPFTSPEIVLEVAEGPPDALWRTPASVFEGVPLERAPVPFEYTRVVASYTDKPGDAKMRRHRFFADLKEPRLDQLRRVLGPKKDADAFHILTAERAGLDAFLTDDRRVLNVIARSTFELHVRVVSPVELIKALDSAV